MKVNNVIGIPASLKGDFFRKWVEYLTPLHNLANREKDVLAAFIKARFGKPLCPSTSISPIFISLVVLRPCSKGMMLLLC